MHARHSTRTALVLLAFFMAGCGGAGGGAATPVPTTPPSERSQVQDGVVVVKGDYGPDQQGPYELDGRYRASFVQRGDGVDFSAEVPFTAHLEAPAADGPGEKIKLFQRAAAKGARTISARGRYDVVVDFGDSPFEIRLEPLGR